jgi:hypothetical protein
MTPRAKRTAEELQVSSRHVYYEVSMMAWTARRLRDPGLPQEEVNALLESFTIHTRALQYFFHPPTKVRADDVLAQDFMPDGVDWSKVAGARSAALETVPARVGTEIAHISYGRLSVAPEAKAWNVTEIAEALRYLVVLFAKSATNLDAVWSVKPSASVLEVSKWSGTATATNATMPATAVNTPAVNKLFGSDR